jgi:hypothetical protein
MSNRLNKDVLSKRGIRSCESNVGFQTLVPVDADVCAQCAEGVATMLLFTKSVGFAGSLCELLSAS